MHMQEKRKTEHLPGVDIAYKVFGNCQPGLQDFLCKKKGLESKGLSHHAEGTDNTTGCYQEGNTPPLQGREHCEDVCWQNQSRTGAKQGLVPRNRQGATWQAPAGSSRTVVTEDGEHNVYSEIMSTNKMEMEDYRRI